jgi:hypothetical protein
MGERPIEAPTAPLTSPPVIKLDEELPEAWEAAWRLHCAFAAGTAREVRRRVVGRPRALVSGDPDGPALKPPPAPRGPAGACPALVVQLLDQETH